MSAPRSVPSIIVPSNTPLQDHTHTHPRHVTVLTGCHGSAAALSVSKNPLVSCRERREDSLCCRDDASSVRT